MEKPEGKTFCPTSQEDWRQWLQEHHQTEQSVWLVQYKKNSGTPSISWSQSVEQALCFGWIDSVRKPLDDKRYIQFFSRRKPNGTWSKVNKEKVQQLMDAGLMTPAGLASVTTAKQNGSWNILDAVEELIIPKDLEKAFTTKKGSKDFFVSLSKSARKAILQWLVLAKQQDTRQKRIDEIVEGASQQLKPKQFR